MATTLGAFHSSSVPWLQSLDAALFRAINQDLSHPFLDWLMPIFAWNAFFVPVLLLSGIALLWKGGRRGRIFVFLLVLVLALGDAFVINTIKHAVARPRPFQDLANVNLLVGQGRSASMPSSHTSTWFAGMLMAWAFYRRTIYFMAPLAFTMAFSRVYVGVHYPSDVTAGAILGMGYAAAGLVLAQILWRRCAPRWLPEWFRRTPVLVCADNTPATSAEEKALSHEGYLRLGYILIAIILLARLLYLTSGKIQLSEDEAYQWLWSKHLALSYYSKPLLIACVQFLGTRIWGDTEFGVRFFSPVIAAVTSLMILRFMARNSTARAGFWLILILNCTPLLAVGGTLLTVDPLLVLFWTAAMVCGWAAVQSNGRTADWLWTGLWIGLGFLSKYTAALQILCFAIFFLLRPESRIHLRRPGPYIALLIAALCTLPVIIWNAQHAWITVDHVASNAARADIWRPWRSFPEFLGAEFGLLNPIFFLGMFWAMFAFWRSTARTALWDYCFCMGGPLFLGYMLFSLYKRVFPNWIAASVIPLFCLMVLYWQQRTREGRCLPVRGLAVGLALGAFAVILLHDTDLTKKVFNRTLPAEIDPLRRVRSWSETARVVSRARETLLAETKPVFVVTDHYGMASELSFYIPDAKASARQRQLLVYPKTTPRPRSQFYFWPGYRENRRGQNAIFVEEIDPPKLAKGWWWKWLRGETKLYADVPLKPAIVPAQVIQEFESVTDLGIHEIKYRGRVFRRVHLFACRNLR